MNDRDYWVKRFYEIRTLLEKLRKETEICSKIQNKTTGQFVNVSSIFTEDAGYETKVFSCDENGNTTDFLDLDRNHYKTYDEMITGHKIICDKWENS